MNILVSGSHGLVGSALVPRLVGAGHVVTRLVRRPPAPGEVVIPWDPMAGSLGLAKLEGLDAVIHLAGESLASGRWTLRRKARLRQSRIRGTRVLAQSLARLAAPPRVLVSASAIGYYGHRGEEILDEASPPGTGFLPQLCRDWEAATEPAARAGIRVVHLRFGIILSDAGGALGRMLLPFRLGLGGPLGSGTQHWSWIALDDAVGVILHALKQDSLAGPVNAVAPNPVTNLEFTRALGRALRRPALLPVPAWVARLALGEMTDELLLASTRVVPRRLLAAGHRFRFGEVEDALRHLLEPERPSPVPSAARPADLRSHAEIKAGTP